jgi:hypothetical protein
MDEVDGRDWWVGKQGWLPPRPRGLKSHAPSSKVKGRRSRIKVFPPICTQTCDANSISLRHIIKNRRCEMNKWCFPWYPLLLPRFSMTMVSENSNWDKIWNPGGWYPCQFFSWCPESDVVGVSETCKLNPRIINEDMIMDWRNNSDAWRCGFTPAIFESRYPGTTNQNTWSNTIASPKRNRSSLWNER